MNLMITVGVVFGGVSSEHQVSLMSARNVMSALDLDRFRVIPIGITTLGEWLIFANQDCFEFSQDPAKISLKSSAGRPVTLARLSLGTWLIELASGEKLVKLEVVFPVLHGPLGEDGTIQGLFEMFDLPYVGSGVAASAVCMDKDIFKRLLSYSGLNVAKFETFEQGQTDSLNWDSIRAKLGSPVFVKPANMGSSLGVNKAGTRLELSRAVELAFQWDKKILIEQAIKGREIECAVLGGASPSVSTLGEIVPRGRHTFYSYEAKYIDSDGASLIVPAKLSRAKLQEISQIALKVFEVTGCADLARVDFFLTRQGQVVVNELNTIPGFTNISMYPRLWQFSGLSYQELVNRLIELGLSKKKT